MPSKGVTFFISDAHLGQDTPEKEKDRTQLLLEFLDYVLQEGKALYILGDLFDFFFEFRTVIYKEHFPVLCKLAKLSFCGVEVYFMGGNHDWWHIDFFKKYIGASVVPSPYETLIDGKRVYLHHGDGIAKGDWSYRAFRKVIRHPASALAMRLVHPDLAREIARLVSKKSRGTITKKAKMLPEYEEFAEKKLAEGFDAVIMGHTHIPQIKAFGERYYINTGNWIDSMSYASIENGVFRLNYWKTGEIPVDLPKNKK